MRGVVVAVAVEALTVALGPDIPDNTRVAAGEMSLLVRNPALALAPKEQRQALAAAIDDLRAIARIQ